MSALIQLGVFFALLALGFFFGRRAEKKHYASIHAREDQYRHIVTSSDRFPPTELLHHRASLVSGNVVVSIDYFKMISASLRNLIGGRISAYESLLDRARREAVLRMQAEASAVGAEAIINIKFQTSRIGADANRGLGTVELLAYGTALAPGK